MAWTQSDIDKLQGAIARGVRRVTYDTNRTVEYHSIDEMLKVLGLMRNEVGGNAAPPRTVGVYCSGLQGSILYSGRRGC